MKTRLCLLAGTALAIALLASPAAATITVPYPPLCSVEPVLVGDSNGMQIGDGFKVTVRDVTGATMAGVVVHLAFAGTTRPYNAQVAPAQAQCPDIANVTNGLGNVVFQARFGGYANAPAIQVIADGFLLKTVPARSTDLDADGATTVADFSRFRINFLTNPAAQETDYDETGLTDLGDFAIFRTVYLNDIPGVPCP